MRRNTLFISVALQAILSLTTADSDSVSLSDFQPLELGLLIPGSCSKAYKKSILDCDVSDFANGAACSDDCIQGLKQISFLVNTNCPGVIADSNSLLGEIFQGQLVSLLCPNTRTTTTSTTPAKTTAAPATSQHTIPPIAPATTQSPETISSRPIPPASIVVPPSSDSLSFSTKSVKTSADGGLGDETSTSTSTEATSTPVDGLGTPLTSTSSARQKQTSTAKSGGQSAQSQQAAALANTGGGSLFDVSEAGSSASERLSASRSLLLCCSLWMLCLGLWFER